MFRLLYHLPAPNFGKTFGPSVTTGQSWAFGGASSLSEIGRQEVKEILETGMPITSELMPIRSANASRLAVEQIMEVQPLNCGLRGLVTRRKQLHMAEKKQSRSTSGTPFAYTWAGLPRYRMAGWLMLAGMTVSALP